MRTPRTQLVTEFKRAIRGWQLAEIKKGIAEADAGDFATQAEVDTIFARWANVAAKNHPPKT